MSLELEDFDEIDKFLKQHFEKITPEEFKRNLKDTCPDLFDNSNQSTNDNKATTNYPENSLLVNNDPEYQEIDQILKDHFKNVTPEEFRKNLEIACPDLIKASNLISASQNNANAVSNVEDKKHNSIARQYSTQENRAVETNSLENNQLSHNKSVPKKLRLLYIIGSGISFGLFIIFTNSYNRFTTITACHLSQCMSTVPSPPAIQAKPVAVGDSMVYGYLQVSDNSGKKANINVVLLSSKYRWQIKQDKILQDANKNSIVIDKLNKNLQKDGVYEAIKSSDGVSRIISIGTASCEGSEEIEEMRAEQRALATNKFIVQKMFSVGQYSFINLGKFKKDDCNSSPEKTSWQRALIILGVGQEEEGVNITEAVRARLTKIPVDLQDYSLGGNDKFQVKDIKSE